MVFLGQKSLFKGKGRIIFLFILSLAVIFTKLFMNHAPPEYVYGEHTEFIAPEIKTLPAESMIDVTNWNSIKQVYVINLNTAVHRLEHITRQLDWMSITFIKINAVSKDDLVPLSPVHPALLDPRISYAVDFPAYKNIQYKTTNKLPATLKYAYGVQAVMYSHMYTLLQAIDAISNMKVKDGPVLIIEDDVVFDRYFKDRVTQALSLLNENVKDWDILALGWSHMEQLGSDPVFLSNPQLNALFTRSFKHHGAHCYVVNGHTSLSKLFHYASKIDTTGRDKFSGVADLYWWKPASAHHIKVYAYSPNNIAVPDNCNFISQVEGSSWCGDNGYRGSNSFVQFNDILQPIFSDSVPEIICKNMRSQYDISKSNELDKLPKDLIIRWNELKCNNQFKQNGFFKYPETTSEN